VNNKQLIVAYGLIVVYFGLNFSMVQNLFLRFFPTII